MKYHISLSQAFVLLSLLCFLVAGHTQNADTSPNVGGKFSSSSAQRDGIAVSLRMSDETYIPRQLNGVVEIKNSSNLRTLTISALRVSASGRLSGIYQDADVAIDSEQSIDSLSSREFRLTFIPRRTPTIFEHAMFRSGANEFVAIVQYYTDDSAASRKLELTVDPELTTSNIYVIAGGFFGALLLIAFIIASKALAVAKANQLASLALQFRPLVMKWSFLMLVYAINGLVVALLLVLLSAGLNAFPLPVSFKLQDFTGGLVVGLFSVTLGKFLSEKLSLV